MEESRKLEQTPVPMWLSVVAVCFFIPGFMLFLLKGSNSVKIFDIVLPQLAPTLMFIGFSVGSGVKFYDIVRQWRKFVLSMQMTWLLLLLLTILFIILSITNGQPFVLWITMASFVSLIVAIGWAFGEIIKR
jgi:hypothetical protein